MILKRIILKTFTYLSLSVTAYSTIANAVILKSLDEMKTIVVPISQEGLTRIKVKEDRVLHVFGNAGEYVLETDSEQGQIFIRPLDASHPISLTLTTELGLTQDLTLIPKNQAPEALILEENEISKEITKEREAEKIASAPLFVEEIEELIQACQEGRIPLGYKEMPISLDTLQAPYPLMRELQGEHLRGLTYRVQNKTKDRLTLSEAQLAKGLSLNPSSIIAILISQKTLTPAEGANVYVVARTN